MSAFNTAFNRKRRFFPDFRDSSSDSDSEEVYPPRKRRKNAEFPVIIKDRLQQISRWFWEINLNKFARMALLAGSNLPKKEGLKNVSEEDDEEEELDEDSDSDIQEIKENISQEKTSPLVLELENCNFFEDSMQFRASRASNGSLGLHYKSPKVNGATAKDLRTRYHGAANCIKRREKTENLKRRPLISDPATEIEVILGCEPEVITVEGDGIEILSESPISKQKRGKNWEKLPSAAKQTRSTPKQASSSAQTKSSSCSSRSYTANEVVRLQEKAQYKLLLEKYISGPPYHHACKKSQSNKRTKEDSRLFSHSHFDKQILEQPVGNFIEKYYPPCRLLSPKGNESNENKEEEPPEIILDDDEDDEIEVIDMKLPQCRSVFQSELLTDNWFKELKRNVQAQAEERSKIVEDYEKQLEAIKKQRLLQRIRIDSEEPTEPEFPELTPEMEAAIDNVLNNGAPQDFICYSINNNNLIRKDFESLEGTKWLNDAVINSYFDLIVERSKQDNYPSVHAFNTFFYGSLKGKGYSAVRRWTRKIDIFSYDLNFVPIHLTFHWCLAVIDHRSKKISYYDSMGTGEEDCLDILHDYLCLEYKDKKGQILDPSTYVTETMRDIPQQMNGSDCGMFTLKYAEYIARNAEITFDQTHMNYFRRRTVYELLTNQILS